MIAAAITENVLNHVDALIDFHSGGSGGRLQARVDYNAKTPEDLKAKNLALARAFGAPFVHENEFAGAASHYLNGRGMPAVNPEVGGSYLGPDSTRYYTAMMINGLSGMMRHLGMLAGRAPPARQIQFDVKARREIRPRNSGYLVSQYERPEDLGKLVSAGTKLGEVVDLYSYEVLEELVAPFDGYLFFSRYSGVVGGGTQAFALAEAAGRNCSRSVRQRPALRVSLLGAGPGENGAILAALAQTSSRPRHGSGRRERRWDGAAVLEARQHLAFSLAALLQRFAFCFNRRLEVVGVPHGLRVAIDCDGAMDRLCFR